MIEIANADNSIPLILIGSGPKGERTMDNPVTFETKCEFLKYIIPAHYKFVIRPFKNTGEDVTQWFRNILTHIEEPTQVSFIRFAGDKGDNVTKFDRFDDYFRTLHPRADARTVAVPSLMSATIVRKTAYECLLRSGHTDGYQLFREKYGEFYKEFTGQIYSEIIEVTAGLSPEDIQRYIETTKLPKKASTSKKASKPKSKSKKNRANGQLSIVNS